MQRLLKRDISQQFVKFRQHCYQSRCDELRTLKPKRVGEKNVAEFLRLTRVQHCANLEELQESCKMRSIGILTNIGIDTAEK